MLKRKIIIFFSLIACSFSLLFTGCSTKEKNESPTSTIEVAVSIVPEATFVKEVGKERVSVITMIPPGSSPETYEPTPVQMEKFSKSDIFFSIGMPLEKNKLLPNMNHSTTLVPLAEKVRNKYSDLKLGKERDPHIWLSPKRAIVMIDAIVDQLSTTDPGHRQFYYENGEAYKTKLLEMDQLIENSLKTIVNRKFIVFHPAFGYFADDYKLEMYSLEEEGKESTPEHLKDMIDLAKKEQIKVIFYQAEVDSSQSKAFAEELNGQTIQLEPLSKDYIHNLERMVRTMKKAMK